MPGPTARPVCNSSAPGGADAAERNPMYPSGRSRPTSAGHAWINSNFRRHGAEPTANRATETKIVPESAVCSPASRTNQRLGRRLLLPARPRDRQWRWRLRAIPAIVPHGRADAGPGYCHRCQAAGCRCCRTRRGEGRQCGAAALKAVPSTGYAMRSGLPPLRRLML